MKARTLRITRWIPTAGILLALAPIALLAQGEEKPQAPSPWLTSFTEAKTRAAQSGKDIYLCFTGVEWSAVCRKFDEHFLSDPEFIAMLRENFEIVRMDVSDYRGKVDHSVPDVPERALLKEEFEVMTFPSAFLTNAGGVPYAMTGFRPGGIRSYTLHLKRLLEGQEERRDLLRRAHQAKGTRKASLLAQSIPSLGEQRTPKFYGDIMRQVIELDPGNETGRARDFELQLADFEYVRSMLEMDRDLRWTDMVALTDQYIEKYDLTGSRRQAALMNRFDLHRRQGNLRAMLQTLDEVVQINPYNPHGKQADQMLQKFASELQQQAILESLPIGD